MITAAEFYKHLNAFKSHISVMCDEQVDRYIDERIKNAMRETTIVRDECKSVYVSNTIVFDVDSPFDISNDFTHITRTDREDSVIRVTGKYATEGGWTVTTHGTTFSLTANPPPKGCTVHE